MNKIHAVILSAGTGKRAESEIPKQFIKIAGKTIMEHTIEIFEKDKRIDDIIIVLHPMYKSLFEEIILRSKYRKISRILSGGETRQESSRIGVNSIKDDYDFVLIHDAIRPFLSVRIIDDCIRVLRTKKYGAVDVAIPSADTIIKINKKSEIEQIPFRGNMLRGQTPQGFRVGIIKKAHELAENDRHLQFTDDCGLVLGYKLSKVYVVKGEEANIKLTYPEDIYLAEKLFQVRKADIPESTSLKKLSGKVIVVFGASRGIGKIISDTATGKGGRVYGFSRSTKVDIRSYASVVKALKYVHKKEKKIDYIINTAGILRMGKLELRNLQDITEEIDTNYTGSVNVVKAAIEYLRQTKGSILLFTSSSYTRGRPLYSIYSSTKAAIVNLVQGMAEELFSCGIRINAVNPERTETAMRKETFGKEAAGTLLKPERVAQASLKVVLSNLTGQVIPVKRNDRSD